jgi:EmrB/QacA subfamily drug resistance transporter
MTALARGRVGVPLAVTGLVIGMALSLLDQAVVAVALPQIVSDLGGSHIVGWTATAYVLCSSLGAPIYGRLSDRFGRRNPYLGAVAIFLVASLACAVAPTMEALILARTFQGVGAGALFAIPTVTVTELVTEKRRATAQGALGLVFAIATIGGPLLGGLLTDHLGWRWVFGINVPLGIAAITLTWVGLRGESSATVARIDWQGAGLLTGTVASFLLALTWAGPEYGWVGPYPMLLLALALAGGLLLVRHQSRTVDPFIPSVAFADPTIIRSLVSSVLLGAVVYGTLFYLPTELHDRYGYPPTASALGLLPYILAFAGTSVLSGRLASAGLTKPVVVTGSAVTLAGMALFGMLPTATPFPALALALIVLGSGIGCLMQTLVSLAQEASSTEDVAVVSSLVITVRGLGMATAGAVVGVLLASGQSLAAILLWGTPVAVVLFGLLVTLPQRASVSVAHAQP